MTHKPFRHVLVTNDDGIDAPGLAVMAEVAAQVAETVWVVAPAQDQSGVSHAISLHAPLRVHQRAERIFAISGTPGDCVAMGARHLMGDASPDLVLSGVNRGANLGRETVFSGTVGAAMTALLLGMPAMALSQAFTKGNPIKWDTAATLAPDVIRRFVDTGWARECCLNINFPDVAADQAVGVELTRQGAGSIDDVGVVTMQDPRDISAHWLQLRRSSRDAEAGSETAAIRAGKVSVTPLQFERTNREVLAALQAGAATIG
ncbi:5'/3'-nucleotidase SurE [Novosphingobium colocasiae]|uniref:5'-nucleotidase SurE n=1 Tax=Novosphingobium colocasiae TaxID=1256513 RepID=A0A918P967_9SPHN|nr:5'/3'-nucleotidase SurE [Novosphingobium colocasiae]GGY91675.1 5'-nucleotidase SurE [Novosphingobium colocasiae]